MGNANPFEGVAQKAVEVIRSLSALAAKDTKFYASIDKGLRENFEETGSALLKLANELLQSNTSSPSIAYGDLEDLSESGWKKISDRLDNIFEKIDLELDSIKSPKREGGLQFLEDTNNFQTNLQVKAKPQEKFKVAINNSDEAPFKPKLTAKPHALTPLESSLTLQKDPEGFPFYNHPYEKEILEQPYPEEILQVSEPIPSLDWRETKAIWVDNTDSLDSMIHELKKLTEIAVDLEHHDLRSYYGITCLMQISNRTNDWIIDTLSLRDDMRSLNSIFTDPKIVKVFHGASMDIIWLQRDLGLYIVSLFDTYFASKSLGFQKFSLAFLLENFANFKTSKRYQLADWRVRPIPPVMLDYARADTHFLLNIYDILRNKLVSSGDSKLQEVLYQSRKVATRKFEFQKFRRNLTPSGKFLFNDGDTARYFMAHYNVPLNKEQLAARLFEWRDNMARKYDESPRFVMSNQTMVSICQIRHPSTMQQLRSCFSDSSKILVENSQSLLDLIEKTASQIQEQPGELPKMNGGIEALTLDSARKIGKMFQGLSTHGDELNLVTLFKLLSEKSILETCFSSPIFSIQVPGGALKSKDVHFQDLQNRYELRKTHLDSYAITPFKEETSEEVHHETVSEEPQTVAELSQKEANGGQFITLLKKNKDSKPTKPFSEELVLPSFDYETNENKILQNPQKILNRKKRSFEPYNKQATSGPQAFKGRKVVQSGKSTSFLKKK